MANLSNINNKFLFTDGDFLKIGNLAPINNISSTESGISVINSNVASLSLTSTAATGKTYALMSEGPGGFRIRDINANSDRLIINTSGNATFAGDVHAGGRLRSDVGSDSGTQLNLWADSNGSTFLAGYNFAIYTGNNNARTQSFVIDHLKAATFAGTGTFAGNVTLAKAVGDTELLIEADTNNNNENYNPRLHLRQDGGAISAYFGLNGDADNTFTGALANGAYIRAAGSIQFANGSGTDLAMTIDTSQNVGIGTATPENKLHILRSSSDTQSQLMVQNGSTGDAAIKFNVSGQSYVMGIDYDDSKKFKIASSSNLGTTDRITLLSSGNVGIGTISPTYKLQVAGTTLISGGLKVIGPGSYNTFQSGNDYTLGLNDYNSVSQWWLKAYTTGDFALHENTQGDRFTIKAGGNVGIGTTSPIAQLDIAGNVNQHHSTSTTNNGAWRNIQNLGVAGWLDQTYSAGRVKIYGYENGNTNVSYCEYYVLRSSSGYHIQQIGTRLDVGNTHGHVEVQISGNFLQVRNVAQSSLGLVRAVLSAMKD